MARFVETTEPEIRRVFELVAGGFSQREIASSLSISRSRIACIVLSAVRPIALRPLAASLREGLIADGRYPLSNREKNAQTLAAVGGTAPIQKERSTASEAEKAAAGAAAVKFAAQIKRSLRAPDGEIEVLRVLRALGVGGKAQTEIARFGRLSALIGEGARGVFVATDSQWTSLCMENADLRARILRWHQKLISAAPKEVAQPPSEMPVVSHKQRAPIAAPSDAEENPKDPVERHLREAMLAATRTADYATVITLAQMMRGRAERADPK